MDQSQPVTSIREQYQPVVNAPRRNWGLPDIQELWTYRNLLRYMITSELKTRYKQTILGMLWAIINPLITMVVFTVIFGGIARLPSYNIPYPIFSYSGLVPWTLFAKGLGASAVSVVTARAIIDKIYFPRLLIPLSRVFTGVIDFLLSFVILLVMIAFYMLTLPRPLLDVASDILPYALPSVGVYGISLNVLALPLFMLLALITSLGIGLGLSALHVRFRDIGQVVPFMIQILLYLTPVAYPSSLLTEPWRTLYSLNPMVTVCDGFRWALLGLDVLYWPGVVLSTVTALVMFVAGVSLFQRMQARFPDLI